MIEAIDRSGESILGLLGFPPRSGSHYRMLTVLIPLLQGYNAKSTENRLILKISIAVPNDQYASVTTARLHGADPSHGPQGRA
jgi:hypothetical protein